MLSKNLMGGYKQTSLLKNQATEFVKLTNIAETQMARNYKGFGNQEMSAVIEEDNE